MKFMITALFAFFVSGNFAFAASEAEETQTIHNFMAHLNSYYSDLNVRAKKNLKVPANRTQTLNDLNKLERYLDPAEDFQLDNAALKALQCGRPVCDGGELRRHQLEQ